MSRSQRLRGVVATVLMATGIAGAWAQQASAPTAQQKMNFDIARQPVADALTALGRQSGLTIMLAAAASSDAVSPAVVGDYTPDEALRRILKSTQLKAEYLDSKTIRVRTADADVAPSTDAPVPGKPRRSPKPEGEKESKDPLVTPTDTETPANPPQTNGSETPSVGGKGIAEILVRGSRTMNVDVVRTEEDVQPYTIFDSKAIQRSGATNVEDFLKQQLTMNTTAQTHSQTSPGSPAGVTSSINLRGLGTNETLILIDGRRSAGVNLNSATAALSQPDIGGIPLSAIERIEVLPSSASAIYGGAAIGGVVNIILKRNFSGGSVDYIYDRASSSDADRRTVEASFGTTFWGGRTQVMVAGSYASGSSLPVSDRPNIVNRNVSTISINSPAYLYSPSLPFPGATTNIASAAGNLVLRNGAPLNSAITFVPPGAAPGSDISSGLLADAGKYNFAPPSGTGVYGAQSPLGTMPLVKSLFGTLRQTIFDDVRVFAEGSTTTNSSSEIQNPFSGTFSVPSTASTDPFRQNVRVRFPSNIASIAASDSVTQSATVGMTAPITHGWASEIDYTWSRSMFENSFNTADPAFSTALSSGTLNPFVDSIAHPLNLAPYVSPQLYSGASTLNDVSLRAAGPLLTLPAGLPTLTVGLEHRKEGSDNAITSQIYPLSPASNMERINFGQPQSTDSAYAEVQVPIVAPQNSVPVVNSFDIQLAGRTERYNVTTGTLYKTILPVSSQKSDPPQGVHQTISYTSTNPTAGFKYRPVHEVVVRASYSTAFLPPSPGQFLANPTPLFGFPAIQIVDPNNGRAYPIDEIAGGNPNLKPQKSKDWNFGLIWEPAETSLKGLRADVEFYKIAQPGYITRPTPQQVISDPSLASRVTRNPTTGLITLVDISYLNATQYRTSGWDVAMDYDRPTAFGTLSLHAASTFIRYDQRQYGLGTPFIEYAGYPNDGGEGKIKANGTLQWNYRHWTLSWATTFYSSYKQEYWPGSPSYIQAGGAGSLVVIANAQGSSGIPAQTYHDVHLSYDVGPRSGRGMSSALLSNVSVEVGVKNLFNRVPPLDAALAPYFYSAYGDPWLRTYRVSVRKSF